MLPLAIVSAVVLAVALSPLLVTAFRTTPRSVAVLSLVVWAAAPVALGWIIKGFPPQLDSAREQRPIAVRERGYVTSQTCEACHPEQHFTWHESYHRTMTQVVTPETVFGAFDGRTVEAHGREYRPERRGDQFFIGGSAEPNSRVVLATGSHHMQVYWHLTGKSRKLALSPLVYLREAERWIPETATFLRPPPLGPTAENGHWNSVCQKCHTTGPQPWLRGEDDMDTKVAEFGIACEACHSVAEDHVRLNHDPKKRYGHYFSEELDESIVNPARLPPRRSAEVCGQCHAISLPADPNESVNFRQTGYSYRPGDDLAATRYICRGSESTTPRMRAILESNPHFLEERFWSDGMVRVSGREYNGLIESPCFADAKTDERTMTCLSCHSLHQSAYDPRPVKQWANDQLKQGMDGDAACLQCHDSYGADIEAHTHHEASSSGSRCYNCHMPYTTYGLLTAIRSHTVDSPSTAASVATGRPNACNQCHLDKTLGWTATHLDEWYGIEPPGLTEEQKSTAAAALWALRGDAGQRALMAWSMGWGAALQASGSDWVAPFLGQLMSDPYDAVRYIAYRSLKKRPEFRGFVYDFMGAAKDRAEAAVRVSDLWRARGGARRSNRPEILIGESGDLLGTEWIRLLEARDNRRVYLQE